MPGNSWSDQDIARVLESPKLSETNHRLANELDRSFNAVRFVRYLADNPRKDAYANHKQALQVRRVARAINYRV